jgi:hypothetical protein
VLFEAIYQNKKIPGDFYLMQLEDIIKSLWKEIEQVSDDLPFDNTVPRSIKCIEKWLDLFKEFIEDEHIRIIKDRSVAIFNRCGGKSEFKDLVPLVSKKDYPDAIDISIITFFITGLACYGVINQKELLSLQK